MPEAVPPKLNSFVQLRMTDEEFAAIKSRAAALSDDFRVVTPTDVARVAFRAGLPSALKGGGSDLRKQTPKNQKVK